MELALKYDRLIDVHCDETDDTQSRFLELLNALVLMEGIGMKTTASHTCSFGSADNSYAFRMMKLLKKSGINFISCPTENIYLEGRQDTYPKRRGLTRVKELNDNGINVCFAQDSMSDPWYPLGNGNMMMILDHGIHIAQMMSPEEIANALDLVTLNGAVTMNLMICRTSCLRHRKISSDFLWNGNPALLWDAARISFLPMNPMYFGYTFTHRIKSG